MSGPWDKDNSGANPPPHVLVPSSAAVAATTDIANNAAAGKVAIVHTDFGAAQRANRRATMMLLVILTVVAALFGYLIGWTLEAWGQGNRAGNSTIFFLSGFGILAALLLTVISVVWSGVSLAFGAKMVLHVADAKEVTPEQEPMLHNVVEEMAIASGMPKPKVYVMDVDAENAFATGMSPKNAAIVVTRGLLQKMNREELQGVIGHEMSHVANADTRYMAVVAVTVGLIALVAQLILRSLRFAGGGGNKKGGAAIVLLILLVVVAILAPLAAKLVQLAVSRQREYLADATSVQFTRNPAGLISALGKLDAAAAPFHGATEATQALFIVNPMRSFGEKASALLSTHPATQLRIDRLRNLGG